ncbi:MAG: phenylalanine--tRNA ligase subunit beta [Deltaproteobacteria bacterium]|nr:phenylalanine--tRNA ligase subunit beta [Deltaproteobacteria bacterium]
MGLVFCAEERMKVGLAWLGDFVDLSDLTPAEVAGRLTMIGLEVEDLYDRLAFLDRVAVGRVTDLTPLGSRLSVCRVSLGGREITAVTAAPNVIKDGLYPLAAPGTELPGGQVRAKTVAGVLSQGVLCSGDELTLPGGGDGLLELESGCEPGAPLKKYYPQADPILDISITPNRADALSVRGLARDLAAVLNRPLKQPQFKLTQDGHPAAGQLKISVECPEHCLRYCGRVVNNVKIGPSPRWLVNRLLGAGIRAINNAVDVTNYVMMELGLPLHAFDIDTLAGREVIVRLAGPGTVFTTLDGQERTLKAKDNILICDRDRPVGLGGVMGGLNSEVTPETRHIFLEGACFEATAIRKTSRTLGISTDASYRFERGQDVNVPPLAVTRAASLLAEISGCQVAPGLLDVYPKTMSPKKVPFSPARCRALLGVNYPVPAMVRVLEAIGVKLKPMELEPDSDVPVSADRICYEATLPNFRPDLSREVDLHEEVVRLIDFEALPATLPKPSAMAGAAPAVFRLKEHLREFMAGRGLAEHVSYSFINASFSEDLLLDKDHLWRRELVRVLNPLSEDHGVLRPSLLPGLLAAVRLNQFRGRWSGYLFEVGAVFNSLGLNKQPKETQYLGFIRSGRKGRGTWNEPEIPVDFWDLKGLAEEISRTYRLDLTFEPADPGLFPYYEPQEAAVMLRGQNVIGSLGRLHPAAFKAWGLKGAGGAVYLGEMDISAWPEPGRVSFKAWSPYPGVFRDMAVLVAQNVAAEKIMTAIKEDSSLPLAGVTVFDLYQGDKIPRGQKSLALRLFFQHPERTLTDELVNGYFKTILTRLAEKFSAVLRT